MEITTVKALLGITGDKHDAYLTEIVPILIEFAQDFCNKEFVDDKGNEDLPGGVKLFVAKAAQYNMNPAGVTGRSMGGASYSYDTDFPESIMKMLRKYKRVKFV